MTDTHTTAHIPDRAVQAAEAQFTEYFLMNYPKDCIIYNPAWHAPKIFRAAKAAITENLPHLSAPCSVEVKKLGWSEHTDVWHCAENKEYQITRWWLDEIRNQIGHFEVLELGELQFGTLEQAKAAAQANFERRILSCVVTKPFNIQEQIKEILSGNRDGFINTGKEPHGNDADLSCPCCGGSGHKDDAKPVDVAAVREQCAKLVDAQADKINLTGMDRSRSITKYLAAQKVAFRDAASAVRALSAEPAQGEQWQPIATAPKGVSVLLLRGNGTILIEDWQRFYQSNHPNFTHWMPIPVAPTTEAGK